MRLAFLVLVTLMCSSIDQSQSESAKVRSKPVLDKMVKEIERLDQDLKRNPSRVDAASVEPTATTAPELAMVVQETENNVERLIRMSRNRELPAEYAASIDELTKEIEAIRAKPRITQKDVELLQAIYEDVHIKRVHAEARPNAPFDAIKVTVHTKKHGQETGVYEVWWVKYAYRDDISKYKTFDQFSSPTSRHLPPGKYLMWAKATDGSKATGEKTPKEFGDGKAEVDTDLIAP